ncbi:glycosyltransferase family 2 protein [Salinimicrobium sp. MT39]|uniref:Glycosyltransferase family 2 protein n=1 Tax=Salinimicrobium profundisediminis TaxID=2994553 RepID=A0A9X3I0J1_9FLAO|nr:glycosyltransferase family 2 protein [Salinimicrobium profundisediminis]MCX2837488.1 glycosyltransferase family 2 protein [Salinimicrobium profundisediminis]
MRNPCLLSIITVNLNNLEGLKRTMQSVFEQTWQEFEYIVIDGGSNDGSKKYLEENSAKIDYWTSEPDNGIYSGMNKGIQVAKGEYLLFLNSGDHFHSKKILFEIKDEVIFFDVIYFNIETRKDQVANQITYPSDLRFSFFINATICHQAILLKRKMFKVVGPFDENLRITSDWKFLILALFKYNCSYRKINRTLSVFYLDGISSKEKNYKKILQERKSVLATHFDPFLSDYKELKHKEETLSSLRKSRKIKLLVKLGLLNRF